MPTPNSGPGANTNAAPIATSRHAKNRAQAKRLIARRRSSERGEVRFFEIGDGDFEGVRDHLNHWRGDGERRGDEKMIAALAVDAALRGIGHHAGFEGVGLDARADAGIGGKRFAGLWVANEFDPVEQALAANIADHRKFLQRFEGRAKLGADGLDASK